MAKYEITVAPRYGKYLAEVKQKVARTERRHDQREGTYDATVFEWDTVAVAIGYTEEEAIRDAVMEAFG